MMATGIEWCDETVNPISGCDPISPGCKNCYASRFAKRFAGRFGYPEKNPFAVTPHLEKLQAIDRMRKPKRIFIGSMGDLFHDNVALEWLDQIFTVICRNPQHTFMLLTKRPEKMRFVAEQWVELARRAYRAEGGSLPSWLWLGVTAENQEEADRRIPILLQIPAAVRFVSCEPLLGPINLEKYLRSCIGCGNQGSTGYITRYDNQLCRACDKGEEGPSLDWVIAGAETGPGARPCYVEWIGSLWQQCQNSQTPFFFKQWAGKVETVYPPELVEIQNTRQFPEVPA